MSDSAVIVVALVLLLALIIRAFLPSEHYYDGDDSGPPIYRGRD